MNARVAERREVAVAEPIFVIGCGRSGTTLLYEMLARHPDLAWISNYTQRTPLRPYAAVLSRAYRHPTVHRLGVSKLRLAPRPVEGYPAWDRCRPVADSPNDPPLGRDDVRPVERQTIHRMVAHHVRYQGGRRFLNKNTRNTRRVRYLDAVFPDARFVHIVRDPRATVSSLTRVAWWPDLKIWCRDLVTPRAWEASGGDPVELAADLWVAEVERALEARAYQSDGRYREVRYEDLVADPAAVVGDLLGFLDLPPSGLPVQLRDLALRNMNFKFTEQLSADQVRLVERRTGAVAALLGYGDFSS